MLIKKVTIEILKKGRKYFEVCYPGGYPFKMVINEISQMFQVGQTIENLLCSFEYQVGYKGHGKTFATPVTERTAEQMLEQEKEIKRQSEIKRWREYTESALGEGRIYQRGFNELKTLGFDTSIYKEQIEQIKIAKNESEVKRWSGYCEEKALQGRIYQRGVDELIKLGRKDLADQYCQQAKQNKNKNKEQQEVEECGVSSKSDLIYWSYDEDWSNGVSEGDVVHQYGQWVKILKISKEYFQEDGLSFGLRDDSGTLVSATARLATDEEAAPAIAETEKLELQKAEKKRLIEKRKNLADYIQKHGTKPRHSPNKKLKISGGYRENWFEIDAERSEIWYCEYNGADGDYWGDNNVTDGGWGSSIGWRIEYTEEIASRINALIEENDNLPQDYLGLKKSDFELFNLELVSRGELIDY